MTTGGESKGSELGGYDYRDDIGEEGRSNAVKEEDYEKVARIVPSGGSLQMLTLVYVGRDKSFKEDAYPYKNSSDHNADQKNKDKVKT